jgi:hypothetical protein
MVPQVRIVGGLLGLALLPSAVSCGGSDLTFPPDGSPSSLVAVSGSGQRGTVGTQLPKPLVVQVVNEAARPVRQVSLRFQTEAPGAEILPASIATDDSGYAEVRVRLGTTEGTQTIEARIAEPASELRTSFALKALAEHSPRDGGGNGGDNRGGGHGRGHGHDDHDDGD